MLDVPKIIRRVDTSAEYNIRILCFVLEKLHFLALEQLDPKPQKAKLVTIMLCFTHRLNPAGLS